jgi:hypothetical protein
MRFLLPHERWLVPLILGSQRKRRTAAVVAMEQRYGPDGMIWPDASLANVLFVAILAVAGFVIVFAHPTRTSAIAGYLLAAVAVFWVCSGSCALSGLFRPLAQAGSFAVRAI